MKSGGFRYVLIPFAPFDETCFLKCPRFAFYLNILGIGNFARVSVFRLHDSSEEASRAIPGLPLKRSIQIGRVNFEAVGNGKFRIATDRSTATSVDKFSLGGQWPTRLASRQVLQSNSWLIVALDRFFPRGDRFVMGR